MRVRRAALDAIVAHAAADAPLEACGLLLGAGDTIDEARPAANLRRSPVTYRVDPRAHFDAIRAARASGRRVLGAYHSHPRSPAVPSPTDVRESADPDWLHVIVSPAPSPPEIRAYRIDGGNFTEIDLVRVP